MKKFYSLVVALIALCLNATAGTWSFNLKVGTGADLVTACIAEVSYYSMEVKKDITLQNGDNQIEIETGLSLLITPKANTIVDFTNSYGSISKAYGQDYYEVYASSWGEPDEPYVLNVYDESSYRTSSVNFTFDDPSKVTIQRADGTEFKPTETTMTMTYNPDAESRVTVKPRSYSGILYKVFADDVEVEKTYGNFFVDLVDRSGETPVAVQNVTVQANYPDDMKFLTTLTLDGPEEMIAYISVNDKKLDDISAYLKGEGIAAKPGDKVAIGFDEGHKIESVTDNGEDKYAYSQYTINTIQADHNVTVKGHKYQEFDVVFNVTCPEGVYASLGYTKLNFTEGRNVIKFNEKNSNITITAVSGYNMLTISDNTGKNYIETSDWEYYHCAYITAAEGLEVTLEAEKIRRDETAVLYIGQNFNDFYFSYFSVYFANYDTLPNKFAPGYNIIEFRPEDGMFKCYASGYYDNFYAYLNDEAIPLAYSGAQYFEDEAIANNNVYKIFFDNEPSVSTVKFIATDGALNDYTIVKDLVATVDAASATTAVGPTSFDIKPNSENAASIKVTVNGSEVEPSEGVFSFEVTADTEVVVASTSGLTSIEAAENNQSDVYNLQGIRIGTKMSADQIKNLPAGLYIVNGRKTVIR